MAQQDASPRARTPRVQSKNSNFFFRAVEESTPPSSKIKTELEELHATDNGYPPCVRTARLRLGLAMESHVVQLLVVVFIIMDVIAVVGELIIANACNPSRVRKVEEGSESDQLEGVLHSVSTSILLLFFFQQLLLIVAYGLRFFKKVFYVLDFFVIVFALVLELGFGRAEGGLFAVILVWRGVRVVHGFAVTVETQHHEVVQLRQRLRATRSKLHDAQSYTAVALRHIIMRARARFIVGILRRRVEQRHRERIDAAPSAAAAASAAAASGFPDECRHAEPTAVSVRIATCPEPLASPASTSSAGTGSPLIRDDASGSMLLTPGWDSASPFVRALTPIAGAIPTRSFVALTVASESTTESASSDPRSVVEPTPARTDPLPTSGPPRRSSALRVEVTPPLATVHDGTTEEDRRSHESGASVTKPAEGASNVHSRERG